MVKAVENKTRHLKREEPGLIRWELKPFASNFRLAVGNFNSAKAFQTNFNLIINVSDAYNEFADQWFPINEVAPFTYAPFFWFKKLVDIAYENKQRVLVHCHAGVHRSAMMAYTWLLSIGYQPFDIDKHSARTLSKDYEYDIRKGLIPNDLKYFYQLMNLNPTWSMMGILRHMGRVQLLANSSEARLVQHE